MAAVIICMILEPPKIKSLTISIISPSICYEVTGLDIGEGNGNPLQCSCLENPRDGGAWWAAVCGVAQSQTRLKQLSSSSSNRTGCHDLSFLTVEFEANFSLSSSTFIKTLFSSSLLSALKVVSSAYLRLLIFLLAILIPVYASSSLAFLMIYSAYKLNKQGDNIQLWHTPFTIWNQSVVPCPVLTVASWYAYRFLRRQVRWSGIPISWKIFRSLLWSTQSKTLA